jgi:hypothetical protein
MHEQGPSPAEQHHGFPVNLPREAESGPNSPAAVRDPSLMGQLYERLDESRARVRFDHGSLR